MYVRTYVRTDVRTYETEFIGPSRKHGSKNLVHGKRISIIEESNEDEEIDYLICSVFESGRSNDTLKVCMVLSQTLSQQF